LLFISFTRLRLARLLSSYAPRSSRYAGFTSRGSFLRFTFTLTRVYVCVYLSWLRFVCGFLTHIFTFTFGSLAFSSLTRISCVTCSSSSRWFPCAFGYRVYGLLFTLVTRSPGFVYLFPHIRLPVPGYGLLFCRSTVYARTFFIYLGSRFFSCAHLFHFGLVLSRFAVHPTFTLFTFRFVTLSRFTRTYATHNAFTTYQARLSPHYSPHLVALLSTPFRLRWFTPARFTAFSAVGLQHHLVYVPFTWLHSPQVHRFCLTRFVHARITVSAHCCVHAHAWFLRARACAHTRRFSTTLHLPLFRTQFGCLSLGWVVGHTLLLVPRYTFTLVYTPCLRLRFGQYHYSCVHALLYLLWTTGWVYLVPLGSSGLLFVLAVWLPFWFFVLHTQFT